MRALQVLGLGLLASCGAPAGNGGPDAGTDTAAPSSGTSTSGETLGPVSGSGESSADGGTTDSAETTVGSTGQDACAVDIEPTERIVLTTGGPVEGAPTEQGPLAFLGIPYVAAPVGQARWMPPQLPECWTDLMVADALGPQCPQLESASGPVIGNEDCLYLNVWTPAANEGARPVLVFIHGGGNAVGSGSDPLYDGAKLAAAADQVVVTFNYRLGVLGWLTDPDLPAVNFGLRDQIAALRWVQDNAAGFGGDPQRVTVFGESAGAVNTCTLLGAPDAAGLFRGAIIQSGACNHRGAATYAEQMSTPLLQNSGCEGADDPLECLHELPADSLVALEPTGYPDEGGVGGQRWGPSVDPDTLPMQSLDAMAAGTFNDVPLIVGANAEENWNNTPQISTEAEYIALVTATFGGLSNAVLQRYPVGDYESPRDAYVAITSDLRFVCTARRSLRAASSGRGPAYRYHFAHDDYFTPSGDTGAFHGLELAYVFGNFDAFIPGVRYPMTAADERMRDTMQGLWSSFAAGELSSDPAWPVYDPATDPYLLLEDPVTAGQGVRTEQCDFWDQLAGG